VAGPWFTVTETTEDWIALGEVQLSNGRGGERATLQYRVRLEERR